MTAGAVPLKPAALPRASYMLNTGLSACLSVSCTLTYLADKLDLDAIVLQPLSRVLQRHVDFPRYRLAVVEEKIFVLPAVFALVLSLLSSLGVIQNYVDVRTLTETKEAHDCTQIELRKRRRMVC